MNPRADKAYIELLKKGDYEAFDALFKKYSERLYAFSLSITKKPFIAEEITQITFLKIWDKRHQINEHFSFKSFLFSIAYHETISYLRKEDSERNKIGNYSVSSNYETNETEWQVEFSSFENFAKQIIENFPEKRKEIFKLSREQGLSNKEIAEKLNISIKTVENQMTKALHVLRDKLGEHEILGLLFYFLMFYP